MTPRPLPKSIPEKEWQSWPTFDELRAKRPDIKAHRLRAMLADVRCYRCKDGSVRYVQEELDELIEEHEASEEAMRPANDADGRPVPQLYDSMVLFRESMKVIADLRRSIVELSESAGAPMRMGLELITENVQILREEVNHYREVHGRTLTTYETLMSQQAERDLRVQRAAGNSKLREQAVGLVMGYVPQFMAELKASAASDPKAAAALQAILSLEPEVFDAIAGQEDMTPAQRKAWTKLRDILSKEQRPNGQGNQQSNGQAAS